MSGIEAPGFTVERDVALDLLEPTPGNPNVGDTEAIRQSIEENGWLDVIVANRPQGRRKRGRIVAGEHRWRALRTMGASSAPAVVWIDVADDAALRALVGHNQAAKRSIIDPHVMAGIVEAWDGDLTGSLLSPWEADAYIAEVAGAREPADINPPSPPATTAHVLVSCALGDEAALLEAIEATGLALSVDVSRNAQRPD